jgi:hypothetical protein
MKRSRYAIGGLIVAVLLPAGFLLCEFLKLRKQIAYGFDFGSALDAIVLIAIGALVEYAYSKTSSDRQADTELLLSIVAEARTALADLERVAQACQEGKVLNSKQQYAITCAERQLSNAVHSVEKGLQHCDITLISMEFQSLKDARLELKDSLTDRPFPGPYDYGSLARVYTAFKRIRDELTRLAFAINRR